MIPQTMSISARSVDRWRREMMAVPLIDPALLQAKLILATRRGRVLPVATARFAELLKGALL
jgi:hypothetical protein